jgi:predicted HAD superfamily Cof-like phosphohydrolase
MQQFNVKHPMRDSLSKVMEFHAALGAMISKRPTLLQCDVQQARDVAAELRRLSEKCAALADHSGLLFGRLAMDIEELAEWVEAHADGDLVAAADAWGDRQYVLLGDAVATGLPAQGIFDAVHESNMTKVMMPADNLGKAQKDAGFRKPNLAHLLEQ